MDAVLASDFSFELQEEKEREKEMMHRIQQLPDWMYHAIEESFTCQFVSVAGNGTPIAICSR